MPVSVSSASAPPDGQQHPSISEVMRLVTIVAIAFVLAFPTAAQSAPTSASRPTLGIFLWYPGSEAPEDDGACQELVNQVQPSRKKLEDWIWGRVPHDSSVIEAYYLVLTENRMEPTFSAEGDYDYGAVTFGPTVNGETQFALVPDDHPDMTIHGSIAAEPTSDVVVVTLRDVPAVGGKQDRTLYFCRFDEPAAET